MAKSMTITIQDDVKAAWIMDGFIVGKDWAQYITNPDYDDQIPEDPITNPATIPNPVTKLDFLKSWVIEQVRLEAIKGHTYLRNVEEANEAFNNIQID